MLVAACSTAAATSFAPGTAGTSLSVEKGSVAFTVSVLGVAYTAAQAKEDEKTLAGYVLARWPCGAALS